MEKESYNIDNIISEVKKRKVEPEPVSAQEPEKEESVEIAAEPEFKEVVLTAGDITEKQLDEPEYIMQQPKAQKEENNEDMVDFLLLAEEAQTVTTPDLKSAPVKKEKFFKTKKGKILKSIIIVLVLLIVGAEIVGAVFINNMLNKITDPEEEPYTPTEYYDGMDFLQEEFPMILEQSASDVYSYREYLKYWYQNGDPVRSSHVLNILLIGEDTRGEEISDTSRADSAIIASINVDTGTIHLTSILRDLFVYYEVNGEGRYGKINESAAHGGMKTYINTLERYYKISIDNYAVVNFASFPKIIDALNGVEIALTNAEVKEVNNHPKRYLQATLPQAQYDAEGNPEPILLTGEQALAYCRIRKIDSDNVRADRQKTVLIELINKTRKSGAIDAVKVVNQLAQYTKTGYTKKELISIGNTALRDGWLSYKIKTATVPTTENSSGGQNFSASKNNWIWLADVPKDAYDLQMTIYGKSNIQLNENRPNYIAVGR